MVMIPIFRPHLPKFIDVIPLLNECEQRCIYSNNGPLLQEFESNLANYFNVSENSVCAISNGTLALVAAIKAMQIPKNSVCLMPSWTFTATPAAAKIAGLEIIFCDVDESSMMLTPSIALDALEKINRDVELIITVSAFGAPVNTLEWDRFTNSTGIPVLINGDDSFDQTTIGFTPTILSLHETKIFGIGEGGLLLSTNFDFIKNAKQYANFGFKPGQRVSESEGINASLNEIAAAMGIVALKKWSITRGDYQKIWDLYAEYLPINHHYTIQNGFGNDWLSTNFNVILKNSFSNELITYLQQHSVESSSWWGNGCHNMPAYKNITTLDLDNTNNLVNRVVSLPFHTKLNKMQIIDICQAITQFFDIKSEKEIVIPEQTAAAYQNFANNTLTLQNMRHQLETNCIPDIHLMVD